MNAEKNELRFGVIGLGRACTSFLPSLVNHPHIRITAGADPRKEAQQKWSKEFNAEVYSRAEDLLKSPNVDAVYIATPHALHAEQVLEAAKNGKHVIVEKPMALSLEECDQMIDAVEKYGIKLVVGHSHVFDPPILKMKEIITSGQLGKVKMIHTFNYKNFMYIPLRTDELDPQKGGGVIFNQGSHQVDIVRWLGGGMVKSVRAMSAIYDPLRPVEGAYACMLEFQEDIVAMMIFNGYGRFDSDEFHDWVGESGLQKTPDKYVPGKTTVNGLSREEEDALKAATGYGGEKQVQVQPPNIQRYHPHFGMTIVSCEKGDVRISRDGLMIYDDEKKSFVPVSLGLAAKIETVDELYQAVMEDIPIEHDARWGKANLEVCLAMKQSAETGKEVFLSHQVAAPVS